MAKQAPSSNGSFLGGGPKFNQAGNNAPMAGEHVAAEAPKPPFGGPRVWAGVIVVLVLGVALWYIYGAGLAGVHKVQGRGNLSIDSEPAPNPDSPQ